MEAQAKSVEGKRIKDIIVRITMFLLAAVAIYFIVTHIKSILMIVIGIIVLAGALYAAFRIAMVLFGILMLIGGIIVIMAASGWLLHLFG